MLRLRSTTRRKLYTLARSRERYHLDWIKHHITYPLGDWKTQPNTYRAKRHTAKLTAELPAITGWVYSVGGPTVPIPIYEQETDRIPLKI